ncbi:MAG TPA: AMP-binding protein [Ktedonobacterales bacterium]|jgi:phenylacetate-CoA ligase
MHPRPAAPLTETQTLQAALQTASREAIAAHQLERVQAGLQHILASNGFYQRKFAGLYPQSIRDEAAFRQLPFTTKGELIADQLEHPVYGTNLTYPLRSYLRLHQTSGTTGQPLKILDTPASWDWWADCWSVIYQAAGVTDEDILFLAFSFGPFIGFWSAYEGAKRVGALIVPGGGQTSVQRLQTMLATKATVLVCTPTYALHLAEVAQAEGIDIAGSDVRLTIHAGEPGASIPNTRRRIETAWGARTYDHLGMTEMGAYGFTCLNQDAVHVNEAEFIAEIMDPLTGQPVAEGERGELVLTNLGRWGTPAIRYRTGDLVQRGPTTCACGCAYLTLPGGVLGRLDGMLIVRGVNVYPASIEDVLRGFPEVEEFRITVTKADELDEIALDLECPEEIVSRVEMALRQGLSLRVPVRAVPSGTLPRFELKARRVVDLRSKAGS